MNCVMDMHCFMEKSFLLFFWMTPQVGMPVNQQENLPIFVESLNKEENFLSEKEISLDNTTSLPPLILPML